MLSNPSSSPLIMSIPHTLYMIIDSNLPRNLLMNLCMNRDIGILKLYRCRVKELCRMYKQITLTSNVGGVSLKCNIPIVYDLRSSTRCLSQQIGRHERLIWHVGHKEMVTDPFLESLPISNRGSSRATHGRERKGRSQQLIERRVLTYNPLAQEKDKAVQTANL